MEKQKRSDSISLFEWLNLRKFCFLFSLKTGIQLFSLSSFMISMIIVDTLLIKLIEEDFCKDYRSHSLNCNSREQIILTQACLALVSATVLWFLRNPAVVLCWVGSKFVVGVAELAYLPLWTRETLLLFLPGTATHLCSSCPLYTIGPVIFIVVDLYGVLVALSYYKELADNPSVTPLTQENPGTSLNIPAPPELPSN